MKLSSVLLVLAGALGCEPPAVPAEVGPAQAPSKDKAKVEAPAEAKVLVSAKATAETKAKAEQAPPKPAGSWNTDRFPRQFQVTSMRGTPHAPYLEGNTLDAIQAAAREGIAYIEVDLVLTRDESLVTAHQAYVKDCGPISKMQLNQVLGCRLSGGLRLATLDAVLALPFKGVFLDLKDTREADETRAQRAVERAAGAVVERQRQQSTVLMLYNTPAASVRPVTQHRLRAGVKGYPKSVEEARAMANRAAELGFEMLSVNTDYVTAELLADSARQGVWHLPWSTDPNSAAHWRALAEAGAGGLIVLNYELAQKDIAPHWVDARTLAPSVSSAR